MWYDLPFPHFSASVGSKFHNPRDLLIWLYNIQKIIISVCLRFFLHHNKNIMIYMIQMLLGRLLNTNDSNLQHSRQAAVKPFGRWLFAKRYYRIRCYFNYFYSFYFFLFFYSSEIFQMLTNHLQLAIKGEN